MVEEIFFWRGSSNSNPLQQFQNHSNLLLLLSGPPSSVCQQRYANPRGRDLAMIKSLALCHNAINYANQKGSCKLLLSDTHTHQGDSPRFHFIYKKWIHTTFTIKEDDISGSFILKGKSYSRTDNTGTGSTKAAKYSIALQYLVFDGLVNDQVE
ncbi:hypothetical protein TSUD_61130 [Trifolium subterraneum]|uniref:Uncharacterized protein n=1 Tax=Trifolium subterraneum TaxID=3900 RepID=A0A2Z6NB17_TRISU|nr:hypothetical protein TSUD_61130 [Trifolium subterraneum]